MTICEKKVGEVLYDGAFASHKQPPVGKARAATGANTV